MRTVIALDRVTALGMGPGSSIIAGGLVSSSWDASTFDVASQWDGFGRPVLPVGGLFDLAAGGLRVVDPHPERHEYRLAATGTPGAGCASAGAASPCLVPRLAALAHDRLQMKEEFSHTLEGRIEVESVGAPPPRLAPGPLGTALTSFGAAAVLLTLAHAWRRANAPLGRIEAAARVALRIRPGDPTLEPVRAQIRAMRARAFELEASRRACVLRLRRLDRAAFEDRGSVQESVAAAHSVEVFASLADPRVQAARLERIRAASVDGLKRIRVALGVATLRMGDVCDVRPRADRDPVVEVLRELTLREEALTEVETICVRTRPSSRPVRGP